MPARRFFALLALYGATHVALRLLLSPTLTLDDAREAVLAQSLRWGYLPRQPPFYNWLVWAALRLLGPGLLGLTLVKYACLLAAFTGLFLAARRTLGDPRLAAPAAFSLVLVVPVNWVIHETLTHNVAALAAAALTHWLLLRLLDGADLPGAGRYLALGVAVGVGTLSKFNYLFFAGALLLAALTVAELRDRLLRLRALLAPAAVAVLVAPYALWFHQRRFSLVAIAADEVSPEVATGYLAGVGVSLYYIARMTVYYGLPLVPVFLAAFPGAWAARRVARAGADPGHGPARRLLERYLLAAFAILGAGALLGALTYLKFRWLMPAFFLFPLWLFTWLDGGDVPGSRLRRYLRVLLVAELAVLAGLVASVVRGDRLGRPSPLTVPYDRIARELRAAGFTRGTIVAGEGPLAGNLRVHFPESRVVRLTNPDYVPPRHPGGGQCLIVWDQPREEGVPAALQEWARGAVGLDLVGTEPVRHFAALYHHAQRARHEVRWILLPEGRGDCR